MFSAVSHRRVRGISEAILRTNGVEKIYLTSNLDTLKRKLVINMRVERWPCILRFAEEWMKIHAGEMP